MDREMKFSPPSDMDQIYLVGRYELLKHLRSRRLLGMLVIEVVVFILILAIPPLLGRDYRTDPAAFAQDYYSWVSILVVIGATLFSGDALVSEFQNRTGYLIFPNPVKRITFFFGKYWATLAILLLTLVIFYGLTSLAGLAITGGVSELALGSLGLAILYAISASALGYFLSSLLKGSTGALVLTFVVLILILPIVNGVLTVAKVKPSFSLPFAASAIEYIMETPYPQDFERVIDVGGGQIWEVAIYFPEVETAVLVMVAWAIICVAMAIWLFNRREMAA